MDLAALKAELVADPLRRGYSGMKDDAVSATFKVRDRQIDNEFVTGGEIAACIDLADWPLLPAATREYLAAVIAAERLPNTPQLRQQLKNVFVPGSGSDTRIRNLLKRMGTREDELGLGNVTPSDVADAKRS